MQNLLKKAGKTVPANSNEHYRKWGHIDYVM